MWVWAPLWGVAPWLGPGGCVGTVCGIPGEGALPHASGHCGCECQDEAFLSWQLVPSVLWSSCQHRTGVLWLSSHMTSCQPPAAQQKVCTGIPSGDMGLHWRATAPPPHGPCPEDASPTIVPQRWPSFGSHLWPPPPPPPRLTTALSFLDPLSLVIRTKHRHLQLLLKLRQNWKSQERPDTHAQEAQSSTSS